MSDIPTQALLARASLVSLSPDAQESVLSVLLILSLFVLRIIVGASVVLTIGSYVVLVYMALVAIASPTLKLTDQQRWMICQKARSDGVSDGCLATMVNRMRGMLDDPSAGDVKARLAAAHIGEDVFPLTWASTEFGDDLAAAAKRLESLSPTSPSDRLVRLLWSSYACGDRAARAGDYATVHDLIRRFLGTIAGFERDDLACWLRGMTSEYMAALEVFAIAAPFPDEDLLDELRKSRTDLIHRFRTTTSSEVSAAQVAAVNELL